MAAASYIIYFYFAKKVLVGYAWCKPVLIFAIILAGSTSFSQESRGCLAADQGGYDEIHYF